MVVCKVARASISLEGAIFGYKRNDNVWKKIKVRQNNLKWDKLMDED